MNNKIENRQISMETIRKVADYLEDYKEKYDKRFELDNKKNKNLSYTDKIYEYGNGESKITYQIEYMNGKIMKEEDYVWFVSNLQNARDIKNIEINLSISFETTKQTTHGDYIFNRIYLGLFFNHNKSTIEVTTSNQESEAHNLHMEVVDILEDNDVRLNSTIKHRNLRIQAFAIAVGIIVSYIVYSIIKINIGKIQNNIIEYINNKYVIIVGQWIMAIVLGNILASWYIRIIYKPLLPEKKYAGYDSYNNRLKYVDNLEDYTKQSEVQIGIYWDAKQRREKIEKLYKICKKILLIQIIISTILFIVLK